MHFSHASSAIFALAVLVTPACASIGLELVSPVQLQDPLSSNNDFKGNLNALGLVKLFMADNVYVAADGVLNFYAHASESGFDDNFSVATYSFGENTSFTPWDGPGVLINSTPIAVTKGTLFSSLNALFSTPSTGGRNAPLGSDGFGIFVGDSISPDYSTLYFGYDDQAAVPDDNHDDLIVSVDFIAAPGRVEQSAEAPEPISALVWGGLVGLAVLMPKAFRLRASVSEI